MNTEKRKSNRNILGRSAQGQTMETENFNSIPRMFKYASLPLVGSLPPTIPSSLLFVFPLVWLWKGIFGVQQMSADHSYYIPSIMHCPFETGWPEKRQYSGWAGGSTERTEQNAIKVCLCSPFQAPTTTPKQSLHNRSSRRRWTAAAADK